MAKDLIINDKTAVKATSMVEQLDKLSVAREEFEKTDWARTNQKLYELLGAVYARYEEASAEKSVLALTVKTLKEILKKRGNRVQQNSTALSLFVRYVFNCDRQRIFTYTRAIHAAISHSITPDQLATFITTAGGVDHPSLRAVLTQIVVAIAKHQRSCGFTSFPLTYSRISA